MAEDRVITKGMLSESQQHKVDVAWDFIGDEVYAKRVSPCTFELKFINIIRDDFEQEESRLLGAGWLKVVNR